MTLYMSPYDICYKMLYYDIIKAFAQHGADGPAEPEGLQALPGLGPPLLLLLLLIMIIVIVILL